MLDEIAELEHGPAYALRTLVLASTLCRAITSASSLGRDRHQLQLPSRSKPHMRSATIADSISEALINTPHPGSSSNETQQITSLLRLAHP